MEYEKFVDDSIEFFENAKKMHQKKLEEIPIPRARLQLKKEMQVFSDFVGYWKQEKSRIDLTKKYQRD